MDFSFTDSLDFTYFQTEDYMDIVNDEDEI